MLVESRARLGAGLSDAEYEAAGAKIVASPAEIFAHAELIVKVKEPLPAERGMLRRGQVLFTYLHLAADPQQTRDRIFSLVRPSTERSRPGACMRLCTTASGTTSARWMGWPWREKGSCRSAS